MAANYTAWMAWCSVSPPFAGWGLSQGGTNARSTFGAVSCRDPGSRNGASRKPGCPRKVDLRRGRMWPGFDDFRRPAGNDPGPRLDHELQLRNADVRNHLRHFELRRGGLLELR